MTTLTPDRVRLSRAGGTIPTCDKVLLAFGMTLAQRYGWNMTRFAEFLAEPWAYQKEWQEWTREMREAT